MPVYSSHLTNYEQWRLGPRIRDERQRRNLTLRELAGRVKISTARLSEIENSHHVLDLPQAESIAEALDLPAGFFLPEEAACSFQISRDAEVRARGPHPIPLGLSNPEKSDNLAFWPLANLFTGRHIEPALGRIGPMSDDHPFWTHPYEEGLIFTLKGRMEFLIDTPDGTFREEMVAGDSLYFRCDLPHRLRALDQDFAECLHAFCSPWGMTSPGFELFPTDLRGNGHHDLAHQTVERLRIAREMNGWEQRHVAKLVGVPERQLAQIERGIRPVKLDLLLKLARVYRKPFRELVGHPLGGGPYFVLHRAAETAAAPSRRRRTPVERPNAPSSKTCQPLGRGFKSPSMYPYLLRFLNVDLKALTLHEHHGHEFIYVLDGEIELMTYIGSREVKEILRPGDGLYLDSSVPHLLRGQTRSPFSKTMAEVVDVFWCPLGEDYLFSD